MLFNVWDAEITTNNLITVHRFMYVFNHNTSLQWEHSVPVSIANGTIHFLARSAEFNNKEYIVFFFLDCHSRVQVAPAFVAQEQCINQHRVSIISSSRILKPSSIAISKD